MSDLEDRHWRLKGHTGDLPPLQQVRTGWAGSRVLGGLAEVTVGCMVWAHADGDPAKVRLDANGEPRGGIVLAIYTALDQAHLIETGEPVERQHYRCWNPWTRLHGDGITVLTEVQIVADGCEAPDPQRIARTIRRIDRQLSDRKGPITEAQARLQTDAAHLAAVLMGART